MFLSLSTHLEAFRHLRNLFGWFGKVPFFLQCSACSYPRRSDKHLRFGLGCFYTFTHCTSPNQCLDSYRIKTWWKCDLLYTIRRAVSCSTKLHMWLFNPSRSANLSEIYFFRKFHGFSQKVIFNIKTCCFFYSNTIIG